MRIRLKVLILTIFGAVMFGLGWVYSHGFVEVAIVDNNVNFNIMDQKSGRSASGTTSTTIRKLVRKGGQEVYAQSNKGSYFTVANARGFLTTTRTTVQLVPENERTFIGNNPGNCLYYSGTILASGVCNDTYNNLQVHVPANASTPTYVTKPSTKLFGTIEGIAYTQNDPVLLIRSAPEEGFDEAHFAYKLASDGTISNETRLSDLSSKKLYRISGFKEGFVVTSEDGADILAYDAINTQPSRLNTAKSKDKSLKFGNVIVGNSEVGIVYTDSVNRVTNSSDSDGLKAHSEEFDEQTRSDRKPKSEIVVIGSATEKHFSFTVASSNIQFCGQNTLCTLDEGELRVYDIAGSKAQFLYRITDVNDITPTKDGFLVIRESNSLLFDTAKRIGHTSIGFGHYVYCGITPLYSNYILCLSNDKNKRVAVLANTSANDSDNISEKIGQLIQSSDLKDVSIYRNFVYVTPYVGDPKPNPQTGLFEYEQSRVTETNKRLSELIDKIGIDRSKYSIVFTLK